MILTPLLLIPRCYRPTPTLSKQNMILISQMGEMNLLIRNGKMWAWLQNLYADHILKLTSMVFLREEVKSLPTQHDLETPSYCLSLVELRNCLCCVILIIVSTLILVFLKNWVYFVDTYNLKMILVWKYVEFLIQSGTQLDFYKPKKKKFRVINVYSN
ncbi:hypothetical protein H5410_004186, partial [Solanum commersonii]